MAELITGDDGLPAEEVKAWAKEKHARLCKYLKLASGARKKFLTGRAGSATFIDLFCGTGRARIKETGEWIEGGTVAAWSVSKALGTPFSEILIADIDEERREANALRLRKLGAPVRVLLGAAVEAAAEAARTVNPHGLHFGFIDPYNLGSLDYRIIQSLSTLKRIDMLIHVSKMDHQRNLDINIQADESALDVFAPGWRDHVDVKRSQIETRHQILEYWRELVQRTGKRPATRVELITGSRGQHLYWLLLAAENDLAHKFWDVATDTGQGRLL